MNGNNISVCTEHGNYNSVSSDYERVEKIMQTYLI